MLRLILVLILFLLSLLVIIRAPTNFLWYVSILVTEFSIFFFVLVGFLLFWKFGNRPYHLPISITGAIALVLFSLPVIHAYIIAQKLPEDFSSAFNLTVINKEPPFRFFKMFTGIAARQVAFKSYTYDTANQLTLDFYPAQQTGRRPCVIVIHGGSWAGGDSHQLPELNSELSKAGYAIAAINYRLAPAHKFPSPINDVESAMIYLRSHAALFSIDTTNFVLIGRSAGGQIALSAAYSLKDLSIKGVISFYGPADMVWGYQNPTNPLVLNSRKIMEDYLGGTLQQAPAVYSLSSATGLVTPAIPPTLLIYGKNDPLVSYGHGERLSRKLTAIGKKHFEIYLPWATHGFDYTINGPAGQLSTWAVKRFLETVVTIKNN